MTCLLYTSEVIAGMELEIEDEKEFLQGIASEIGQIKNNRLSLEEYESSNCSDQMFRQIYEEYERRRKLLKKIDFDDMLVLCYELFQKRPDILQMWQKKFQYILIDEFQDINQVQYDVIRMQMCIRDRLHSARNTLTKWNNFSQGGHVKC